MKSLLELKDIYKYYPIADRLLVRKNASVKAIDGVNLSVRQGETLGLVGESGCGKSTLGRLILQLEEPTGGDILFDNESILKFDKTKMRRFRQDVQIIFQDPFSSLNPRHNVYRILGEPFLVNGIKDRNERHRKVIDLMEVVGLKPEHLRRFPHQFSGGQRQRIGVARALALRPKLIICDEAVSALDVSIQAQVINLLQDLQEQFGLTYLFISHDLSIVEHISNRVAVMYLGRLTELANSDDLYRNPLHPYTQALLSASPASHPREKRERTILQGDVPSPVNPPSGCCFHTRCPYTESLCVKQRPEMHEIHPDHYIACHFADQRPSLYRYLKP